MHVSVEREPYLKPNEFTLRNGVTGLMGPSGCGKTTMMNEIFKTYDNVGYLSQDAPLFEFLTVRENIQISLRILGKDSETQRMIENMELQDCCDTLVKHVSGGEKKRCSIAIEMCNSPEVFLFDEPLSSLDSRTSLSIFKFIQNKLCHLPVLLSIHQPSGKIFYQLNHLMLMSKGVIIYSGSPSGVENYFGGIRKIDLYSSVPEYIIDICQEMTHELLERYTFAESDISFQFETQIDPVLETNEKKPTSFYKVFTFSPLFHREFLQNFRNPMFFKLRILQTVVFSAFVGILFFQTENDQIGVQNKNGALFFIVINQIMSNTFSTIQTFPQSLETFEYDYRRKKYPLFNYYLVKTSTDLPFQILNAALFGVIAVFITAITEKILEFVIVLVVIAVTAASFGYFVSTISKDTNVSLVITNLLILPMMLTSGFFMNNESVPVYIEWIRYINPFYYGYNALSQIVWKSVEIDCERENVQYPPYKFPPPLPPNSPERSLLSLPPTPLSQNPQVCVYLTGEDVLEYQKITDRENDFYILILMALVYRALGFFSLYLSS